MKIKYKIKSKIENSKILLSTYFIYLSIKENFKFKIITYLKKNSKYLKDLILTKKNKEFKIKYLFPCINDNTKETPLAIDYFYQDTWAAKKIFELNPKEHYDVGSNAKTIGIISQFTKTYMVDIRPLPIKLKNLNFIKGDITTLPFKNNSIKSISSLCVIEHIGLGRYGDKLDELGSEKAIKEIIRVTSKKGNIFISVPVHNENTIYFNAHRAFTKEYILTKFHNCKLVEEKYIYNGKLQDKYRTKNRNYGTGLFWFTKN